MAEHGESSYRRFLHGDKTALEELIRTYSDSLVRFACGYLRDEAAAEDVMEDTFAALYMKAPRLHNDGNLRASLYRTARNKCRDYLRRHREHVPLEDVENVLMGGDAAADYEAKERAKAVNACMRALPEQYREVLHLVYYEGMPLEVAAAVMGRTPKQIYNLHARAKNTLKKLLEKEGITHEDIR